ncbi:4a-hydroxytetrahydrobiopterin dehydratase [Nocardioides aromaticivorans]|uniref:Putative pterin-4-alpha-carbinolamine dehydratase n=1 Tax=Nocardioides aromaticivorans TaxID=200618 RepID=A0ABX7PRQ4_9ACTN|nr:4a-hydroxytetrahydrobiopterin dehydratase [Nocardioides aromaticivorans]QSR28686.1 4a-hydroxytetrahydrobiopterin dehydratase [Nocardioides aromaticivorans]
MARSYQTVTAEEFTAAAGLGEWRVEGDQAVVRFRTGDFVTGLALVNEIGRLAEEANHHPDLTLSYPEVGIRLGTHDTGTVTDADVALAQAITAVAQELGVPVVADS